MFDPAQELILCPSYSDPLVPQLAASGCRAPKPFVKPFVKLVFIYSKGLLFDETTILYHHPPLTLFPSHPCLHPLPFTLCSSPFTPHSFPPSHFPHTLPLTRFPSHKLVQVLLQACAGLPRHLGSSGRTRSAGLKHFPGCHIFHTCPHIFHTCPLGAGLPRHLGSSGGARSSRRGRQSAPPRRRAAPNRRLSSAQGCRRLGGSRAHAQGPAPEGVSESVLVEYDSTGGSASRGGAFGALCQLVCRTAARAQPLSCIRILVLALF